MGEESANSIDIQSIFMEDSQELCVNKIYMDIKSNENTEIHGNNIIDNENIEFMCNDVSKSHKNIKIEKIVRAGINKQLTTQEDTAHLDSLLKEKERLIEEKASEVENLNKEISRLKEDLENQV